MYYDYERGLVDEYLAWTRSGTYEVPTSKQKFVLGQRSTIEDCKAEVSTYMVENDEVKRR